MFYTYVKMLDIFTGLLSRDCQISAFQHKVNYQHFFYLPWELKW